MPSFSDSCFSASINQFGITMCILDDLTFIVVLFYG
jgi:hypothetical protein